MYNKILTSPYGLHLLQVRIDATLPRRDTDASPSVSPASGGDGQGSCMDRPPYYDLRSRFWLIFTFQWTVEARAVVYVAMGVDNNLLGDSMKLYKLAMFSWKLHQQKSWTLLTEYSTTQKESLPCTSVLSVPCSLVYSLLGKDIHNIFMSVIALDGINPLFSAMAGDTCTCPDSAGYYLAAPTLACCSQQSQGGAYYDSSKLIVCSDFQLSNWVVTDMVTMNSAIMYLMVYNLRVVALVNRVNHPMHWRGYVTDESNLSLLYHFDFRFVTCPDSQGPANWTYFMWQSHKILADESNYTFVRSDWTSLL